MNYTYDRMPRAHVHIKRPHMFKVHGKKGTHVPEEIQFEALLAPDAAAGCCRF